MRLVGGFMNILHLKYAVEVERAGSISQAAENLYMGQPNLSKAIHELESDIGIAIFERTKKGVAVTERGAEFLAYAADILSQFDHLETRFKRGSDTTLSIAVPRASYISYAFSRFSAAMPQNHGICLRYIETGTMQIIERVLNGEFNLGIIRYPADYEEYFLRYLSEKGIKHKVLAEFNELILMSKHHDLANQEHITYLDVSPYKEILHGDFSVPSLSSKEVRRIVESDDVSSNKIYIYERGSQFDLLTNDTRTYIWVSPMPKRTLETYGLVQRRCESSKKRYKDALVYLATHIQTETEKDFESQLRAAFCEISAAAT